MALMDMLKEALYGAANEGKTRVQGGAEQDIYAARGAKARRSTAEDTIQGGLAGQRGQRDESRIKAEKASFDYSSAKTEKDIALIDEEDKLKRYRLENDTLTAKLKATVGEETYNNYIAGKPLRDKETELDTEETKRKVAILDTAMPELEKRSAVASLWETYKSTVPIAAIDDLVRTGWDFVSGDNTQKIHQLKVLVKDKLIHSQKARKQAEGLIQ